MMPPHNAYLSEALQVVAAACATYPDSSHLALTHARLLAECGHDAAALEACEAYLVRFGVDGQLVDVALGLRTRIGAYGGIQPARTGNERISLCMIVKNEADNLPACLASTRPTVHEMIVVDTGSSDRTADIATVFGAQLFTFAWNGSFSDARNYALEQATGDWVLVLDADEVLSKLDYACLAETVRSSSDRQCAWSVLTRNYTTRVNTQGWSASDGSYPEEEHADGWYPSWKVRLFPRHAGIRFSGDVHEMVEKTLRQSGYEIGKARFVVHHYGELASDGVQNYDKQLRYFELGMQKLAEHPDDPVVLIELAVQAGELGRFEQAIELWDRLLVIAPDTVEALFNKGYCLMGLKRYREALEVSRRALELDPDHKEAAFNYGTCELYVGSPEQALTTVEPLAARNPDYPLLQALLITLYLVCGQPAAGRDWITRLQNRGYGIETYLRERCSALDALGRSDMAEQLRQGMGELR